jgi:hypothetical protein
MYMRTTSTNYAGILPDRQRFPGTGGKTKVSRQMFLPQCRIYVAILGGSIHHSSVGILKR